MDCPRCNSPLKARKAGEVKIDKCPDCMGMWLDQGELEKLKDQTDSDVRWMDFEIWKHPERFRYASRPVKCPKCEKDMVAVNYHDTGIVIDYCPDCRGTWLDRGEFSKIIHALRKELETKHLPEYIKASLEEAKEIITHPEGIVHEWKDFTTVLRLMNYRFFVEHPTLQKITTEIQNRFPLS
jgi:Zn-finger nucleic acid-binding protein